MESVKQRVAPFCLPANAQRPSGHNNRNERLACRGKGCDQFALCSLQIQVGQAMGFTGKDRFFPHNYQNGISPVCSGHCPPDPGRIRIPRMDQPRFVQDVNLVSVPFPKRFERCHRGLFFTVKHPGSQLIVGGISQRACYQEGPDLFGVQRECPVVGKQHHTFQGAFSGKFQVFRRIKNVIV